MKLLIIVVGAIVIAGLLIISNYNLSLKDADDRAQFFKLYYVWASGVFEHGISFAGYIIKSEWLPPRDLINYTDVEG